MNVNKIFGTDRHSDNAIKIFEEFKRLMPTLAGCVTAYEETDENSIILFIPSLTMTSLYIFKYQSINNWIFGTENNF